MQQNEMAPGGLRILIVDDEENIRLTLSICLEADGHHVSNAATVQAALVEVCQRAFDLIFLDLRLGVDGGLDLIPRLLAENPWSKIVVITAYASVETAVEAMKRGAADYLPKPFTPAQVQLVTQKVADQRRMEAKIESLQQRWGDPEADFPTASASMRHALEMAKRVAASNATLLIRGEVGVGKGRLARAIHQWEFPRRRALRGHLLSRCFSRRVLEIDLFGFSPHDATTGLPARCGAFLSAKGGRWSYTKLPISRSPCSPSSCVRCATKNTSG